MIGTRKYITRHKVLVVPYVIHPSTNEIYYIMVKDRKTGEWGFVSGGVKKGEYAVDAADRELQEESSNLLHLPSKYNKYMFTSSYRPSELAKIDERRQEVVRSSYTMFMYRMNDDIRAIREIVKDFIPNTECTNIDIRKYRDFEKRWVFTDEVYNKCQLFNRVSCVKSRYSFERFKDKPTFNKVYTT